MQIGLSRALTCTALLSVFMAAPASAQLNMQLEGNQSVVCINSPDGFSGNLALLGPGYVTSVANSSVVTLNKDGTGTISATSVGINHSRTATNDSPAFNAEVSCNVVYTLDKNTRVLTLVHSEPCEFALLPSASITGQIANLAPLSMNLDTGVRQQQGLNVETVTYDSVLPTNYRICHRTGYLFEVKK